MKSKKAQFSFFSLIELLVVVGIMGALLAISIPNFAEMMGGNRLNEGAGDVYSALMRARTNAISKRRSVKFQIESKDGKDYYILSYLNKSDSAYYGLDTAELISSENSKAKARQELPTKISMSGDGTEVIFKPSGKTDGGISTITLSDTSEGTTATPKTVTLNQFTGKVSM